MLDLATTEIQQRLCEIALPATDALLHVAEQFRRAAIHESLDSDHVAVRLADKFAKMTSLAAELDADESDRDAAALIVNFLAEHVGLLDSEPIEENVEHLESILQRANENWGEYLQFSGEQTGEDPADSELWESPQLYETPGDETEEQIDSGRLTDEAIQRLSRLMAGGSECETETVGSFDEYGSTRTTVNEETEPADVVESLPEVHETEIATFPAPHSQSIEDEELKEAFLEDAGRCLVQMEKCCLAVDQNRSDSAQLRQFCRELHTLKGASASVGLPEVAAAIHQLETFLEQQHEGELNDQTVERMLDSVDQIRAVADHLSGASPDVNRAQLTATEPQPAQRRQPVARVSSDGRASEKSDSLIRIRASQLDRLMDMLAELVVLRNRRESHIAELSEFNEELVRCSARLSFCHDSSEFLSALQPGSIEHGTAFSGSNTLVEIAKDIAVVSNSIRDLQKPVSSDNQSISRFIRDFRQELMQLRRVPIGGLFQRLQRAARDAANKEGKRIKFTCVGEATGLEQELQEQLYEPLLHVVRNAVSHGVESVEDRVAAGKPEHGTITLEAQSNSQLLAIETRDDGGGLNYDAIRRRATEQGLISAGEPLSQQELGRLIFHPGFSTRQQATEVSGRGVGMDIVARVVDQMRGRIEIDSTAGAGTSIRLLVPLRSAIEHVMVVRSAAQLFAISMQSVASIQDQQQPAPNSNAVDLSSLLSLPTSDSNQSRAVLMLHGSETLDAAATSGTSQDGNQTRVALEVDEIVGPEEVVIRTLPSALQQHPLCCGLTLSGAGETVVLLDGRKLAQWHRQFNQSPPIAKPAVESATPTRHKQVLVVDDSLSARKLLVKKLAQLQLGTTEAGDGIEALEILRQQDFDLVITDLDMPRLSGLQMLCDLQQRHQSTGLQIPVVVLSSRTDHEIRQRCLDAGAIDFLVKPVEDGQLRHAIDGLNLQIIEPDNEELIHE